MTVAWATGPILSPALGGYLQSWLRWTASFWFLAGWGTIVVLVALLVLPETRNRRLGVRFGAAFRLYGQMVSDRVYLPTALGMACLISVMYGFEVNGPIEHRAMLQVGLDMAIANLTYAIAPMNAWNHVSIRFQRAPQPRSGDHSA